VDSDEVDMQQLSEDLFIAEQPIRFLGLKMDTRMTVIRLGDEILVHSPIDLNPEDLTHLGTPRWVLAPNKLHHLFIQSWLQSGIEGWAAPGLPEKRNDLKFQDIVENGAQPFGPDIETLTVTSFPFSNEVVLFHKPSKTLILTDLLFNFPKDTPLLTKAAMFCACAYPGPRASILEQIMMKRSIARKEIAAILDWDFKRIVLSHGQIIEQNAKQAFAGAYRWLFP
jgi:hypothetical protein